MRRKSEALVDSDCFNQVRILFTFSLEQQIGKTRLERQDFKFAKNVALSIRIFIVFVHLQKLKRKGILFQLEETLSIECSNQSRAKNFSSSSLICGTCSFPSCTFDFPGKVFHPSTQNFFPPSSYSVFRSGSLDKGTFWYQKDRGSKARQD